MFWATNGTTTNPPSSSSLYVGKHVGEDTDTTRADEIVGYLVVEAGSGSVDGVNYQAGVGADTVRGVVQSAPYNYSLQTNIGAAVVSSVGMDGNNGGWPVLYGSTPPSGSQLGLGYDEDQVRDSERNHTTEQVSYLVFE